MESDRCGIYVTASYYPPGQGWLAEDKDSVDARRHSHDMLLLTEKGQSYMEGGLYVVTRPSEKIDVVSQVILSDVIFLMEAARTALRLLVAGLASDGCRCFRFLPS